MRPMVVLTSAPLLVFALGAAASPAEGPAIDGRVFIAPELTIIPAKPLGPAEPGLFHAGNRLEVPPPDVTALLAEDAAAPPPRRAGVLLPFEFRTTNHGQWTPLPGGAWIWTLAVHVPDARGLAVRVQPRVPRDAVLTVYPAARPDQARSTVSVPVLGAWSAEASSYLTRELATDEIRLEYVVPVETDRLDPAVQLAFTLYFLYRGAGPGLETDPLSCHLDVNCYSDWTQERDAVARIALVRASGLVYCSGTLLNRSPSDKTPLFLTARHCLTSDTYIGQCSALWHYETDQCNGTPADPNELNRTSVAGRLAEDATTDIALLGLQFDLPSGLMLAGWDAGYWTYREPSTGIHHPQESYKRITFGTNQGAVWVDGTSCWRVDSDTDGSQGLTELGSSGSAVFDASHRVRGALSQGTKNPTCSMDTQSWYGRLDAAWSVLAPFLAATDPVYVDGSYAGSAERGTETEPFRTVLKGVYAVPEHGTVYIEAGTYSETFKLPKGMTLRARNGTVLIGP